jgi:hypothetical protein
MSSFLSFDGNIIHSTSIDEAPTACMSLGQCGRDKGNQHKVFVLQELLGKEPIPAI